MYVRYKEKKKKKPYSLNLIKNLNHEIFYFHVRKIINRSPITFSEMRDARNFPRKNRRPSF